MEIFWFLFPLSFFLACCGLLAYVLAARRGQFDDLESPANRLVLDEEKIFTNDRED